MLPEAVFSGSHFSNMAGCRGEMLLLFPKVFAANRPFTNTVNFPSDFLQQSDL